MPHNFSMEIMQREGTFFYVELEFVMFLIYVYILI
jgi:hypothetical protein